MPNLTPETLPQIPDPRITLPLSGADAARFQELLAADSSPNEALRRAAEKYKEKYKNVDA